MSKCSLMLAAVSLALMSAGAAAQNSYESRGYGGPLGIGPNFQQGGQHAPPVYGSGQDRSYSVERNRAPQRIDRVQRRRNTDDDDVKTAKKTPVKEEAKEAKTESKAQSENSSIVSIDSGKDKPSTAPVTQKTDTAKADTSKSRNENSTIASVAATATAKADPVKASVTKADSDDSGKPPVCKRYFPTVGQTITVPCD